MSFDKSLIKTRFNFPGQTNFYRGKVREVYTINNSIIVMVVTDRLSAFDVVMPKGIPYKGQILNQIALKMMKLTEDIVPNWLIDSPDPNVSVGYLCEPFKIEMVIRGYLSGHAAREYNSGKRSLCGIKMPNGMKENDAFETPIITPATKAEDGEHDEDISKEDIINRGLVSENDYIIMENYTKKLFKRGTEIARSKGLILVDSKYEFGKNSNGEIMLIDEIHTPDSSRYFYEDGYEERQKKGLAQKQLSKEFVRQWLISSGFKGLKGQKIPNMSQDYILSISDRYIELYEAITGDSFSKQELLNISERIEKNVVAFLQKFTI